MTVGKSVPRVDAYAKVTGQAKYTEDLLPTQTLVGKVLHSTIANGLVKSMDISQALALEGVVRVVTCFDVPIISFPTAGHPWSVEKSHQDVADRRLLNQRVRFYGDDIAVVVAKDEITAARALKKIKVEYDTYEPLLTAEKAAKTGARPLHEEYPDNILKYTSSQFGDYEAAIAEPELMFFEQEFETQAVQHCHLEKPISYAYMENDRIVVVSSTQIPHIVRRVVGQALGIPWGKVRVIKPYMGGGFGNKQEVLYEPLNAYLTLLLGGRCVKLDISREETFVSTRIRHSILFKMRTAVRQDGRLVARKLTAISNQGAYASHGHAIVANAVNNYRQIYQDEKACKAEAYTVYTNLPSAGAMRGYGIPQIVFAAECHMQDIAEALNLDPIDFRLKNAMQLGFVDPGTHIVCQSNGLRECIDKGRQWIGWDQKYDKYKHQTGPKRRGVGLGIFCYKTGVYPISLETASCRLILNQDGSAQLQMGATEIGQGADTVFCQMAAQTSGLRFEDMHIVTFQDTDTAPFDTGAYASRQTYVSGTAVKETAELFKARILEYAAEMLQESAEKLDVCQSQIIEKNTGQVRLSLADLAMESFYSLERSQHITAEKTHHCKNNTFSLGVCFAEVEVDIPVGKVKILNIINVHDSGRIINPQLAEAQVHGGMSMGIGYALSEQMLYNEMGKPLNNNFLDYKFPTSLDIPELAGAFVETDDPSGPYGNKALGEPPAIPQAAAIRNAILNATGVGFNKIPITPQSMIEKFKEKGLLEEVGRDV